MQCAYEFVKPKIKVKTITNNGGRKDTLTGFNKGDTKETQARMEQKIDRLQKTVEGMVGLIRDQGLQINAICGQLQLQGERLRHIEARGGDPVSEVTSSGVVMSEVTHDIRDNLETVVNVSHAETREKIENVEDTVTTGLAELTTSIAALRGELGEQRGEVKDIQRSSREINNKIDMMESSSRELHRKVELFTKVTSLSNTKLKQEIAVEASDTKHTLGRKIHRQTEEMVKIQQNLKSGFDEKLTEVVDNLDRKLPPPGQQVDRRDLEDKLDSASGNIKNLGTKIEEILNSQQTAGQASSDVMTKISGNVGELSVSLKEQADQVEKFRQKVICQSESIIDQVIAEAQMTRGIVSGGATPAIRQSHTWDFHIYNFEDCVRSFRQIDSRVWFVDKWQTYVKANARFLTDNTVDIWLVNAFHPNVLGIEPRTRGAVHINAKVMHQAGPGQDWDVGNKNVRFSDEANIPDGCDGWTGTNGANIATISCDEVTQRSLVVSDKILLKFQLKHL